MSASIDGTAIDKVLRDAVDSGGVPHVAAIAADRDGVIYEGAAGPRAAGESDPVTVDTLFRIMSMTKMPCTVAALQQVEQGNLDLDAPVADYCPEFAEIQVLTGFDGDTPRLRPPARQATVKNLITHTSGLSYWFWSEDSGPLGEGHRHPERGGGSTASSPRRCWPTRARRSCTASTSTGSARSWRRSPASAWTWRSSRASPARSAWTRPRS